MNSMKTGQKCRTRHLNSAEETSMYKRNNRGLEFELNSNLPVSQRRSSRRPGRVENDQNKEVDSFGVESPERHSVRQSAMPV